MEWVRKPLISVLIILSLGLSPLAQSAKDNIPTIVNGTLEWATVRQRNCDTFEVTIRYHCSEDREHPFPDPQEYSRVCDQLIPQGLKKHYEQSINIGDVVYEVEVVTEQSTNNISQPTVLLWSCDARGSNFLATPAFLPFCENRTDESFLDTVAHEFGHAIIAASIDLYHSLVHKGSSTVGQDVAPGAPILECDGSVRNDVMNYFKGSHNCFDSDGNLNVTSYFGYRWLTEADTQGLVMRAGFYEDVAVACGQLLGEPCGPQGPCLPGLTCFEETCVECLEDITCLSNQFCFGVGDSDVKGYDRRCLDKERSDMACSRDEMCLSNNCTTANTCA